MRQKGEWVDWNDQFDPDEEDAGYNFEEEMNKPLNVYDLRPNAYKSGYDDMSQQEMDDEIIKLNQKLMDLANARIKKYGNKVK